MLNVSIIMPYACNSYIFQLANETKLEVELICNKYSQITKIDIRASAIVQHVGFHLSQYGK